ncbi:nuclear transport factor 2 family protein [Streptococcus uberis]|uniref:nuclear transport factor 2 family protein n=1 Tax=Streptococcus uberis TaxID=1349 RepID=UPI00379CA4F4|nr:nuclear transport factor 2 family protein [Streptococcus uberis]
MTSETIILTSIYRDINRAMVEKDVTYLTSIIDSESVLVHMTGYVQPLAEWLEQIQSEEMRYFSTSFKSATITQLRDSEAILLGRSYVEASIWGSRRQVWPLQIEMFFKKRNDEWHVIKQVASTF